MKKRKKILITVKTYPLPSEKYYETVCTAGVDSAGNLVRLYPFPFRSMEYYAQFKKYQWIEVDTEKNPKDPRPESYKAFPETVTLGEHIQDWRKRRSFVLRNEFPTMCHLKNEAIRTNISLAIIKPRLIVDFKAIPCERKWSPKQLNQLNQLWLFKNRPELRKLPYAFKFKYYCQQPECTGHFQTIEDWEVGTLFWKLINKGDSEKVALEKVKDKFFSNLCSKKNDVHFFVGMHSQYKSWMIIGTFCPPSLFPPEEKGQLTLWSLLK